MQFAGHRPEYLISLHTVLERHTHARIVYTGESARRTLVKPPFWVCRIAARRTLTCIHKFVASNARTSSLVLKAAPRKTNRPAYNEGAKSGGKMLVLFYAGRQRQGLFGFRCCAKLSWAEAADAKHRRLFIWAFGGNSRPLPLDAAFNRASAGERVNLLALLIADACCCCDPQVHRFLLDERQLSGTLAAKNQTFCPLERDPFGFLWEGRINFGIFTHATFACGKAFSNLVPLLISIMPLSVCNVLWARKSWRWCLQKIRLGNVHCATDAQVAYLWFCTSYFGKNTN